jgi:hypothetical protein
MFVITYVDVFQLDERIQHRVPGHQLWTVAKVADATGVRHQGCGLGESGGGMAIADKCVSACSVGSNLFWSAIWVRDRPHKGIPTVRLRGTTALPTCRVFRHTPFYGGRNRLQVAV